MNRPFALFRHQRRAATNPGPLPPATVTMARKFRLGVTVNFLCWCPSDSESRRRILFESSSNLPVSFASAALVYAAFRVKFAALAAALASPLAALISLALPST